MARAKRTERAEARRKYRAYLQAQQEAEASGPSDDAYETDRKSSGGRDGRTGPSYQPQVRLGLMAAARAAYRQPTYIDDIRNIRTLVFRSNAVWPILVACVLAGAYIAVRIEADATTTDPLVPLLGQFLFAPVPLLPPMAAGFLAPRATWLAGMIAAFIASMTLVIVLAVTSVKLSTATGIPTASQTPASSGPVATVSAVPTSTAIASSTAAGSPAASPTPAPSVSPAASPSPTGSGSSSTGGYTATELFATMFQLLSTSLAFGALMGALSGWYKRFLSLTQGQRRPPSKGGQRPAQRRRPATR